MTWGVLTSGLSLASQGKGAISAYVDIEVVSEDLKSQIYNYLFKEQGTPRERGDRLMWEAIKKRVFRQRHRRTSWATFRNILDEVTN